jgi:hypothetical protein
MAMAGVEGASSSSASAGSSIRERLRVEDRLLAGDRLLRAPVARGALSGRPAGLRDRVFALQLALELVHAQGLVVL